MRPESLRLLQQAVRINPSVTVSALAADETYGEAVIDALAGDAKEWTAESWDATLEEIDNNPTTLAVLMDTPTMQKAIRAQEAAHAAQ